MCSICCRSNSKKSIDKIRFFFLYQIFRTQRTWYLTFIVSFNKWTKNVAATVTCRYCRCRHRRQHRRHHHHLFIDSFSSDLKSFSSLRTRVYLYQIHMLAFSLFPYSNVQMLRHIYSNFPVFKSTCLPFDWIVNKFLPNTLVVVVVIHFHLYSSDSFGAQAIARFLVKLACVSVFFSCLEYTLTQTNNTYLLNWGEYFHWTQFNEISKIAHARTSCNQLTLKIERKKTYKTYSI